MASYRDLNGLAISSGSAEAVEQFDRTVMSYLAFGRDTGEKMKAALAADPEMVMAHCLLGYFFHLMGAGPLAARARKSLRAAEAGAAGATEREKMHVAALAAWCDGNLRLAVTIWEEILLEHPRDILAVKLAHFMHFYLGDSANLRDSVARILPALDRDAPTFGYVMGMRAFGLEEAGHYQEAEQAGRDAVALNADDIWGVHAVAHVKEMQDRRREGIEWMAETRSGWEGANNFRYHVFWHNALMHLELGLFDETLRLYDSQVWDPASDEYLDLCNDASLLVRLELAGIDIGDRWQAMAAKVENRIDEHILTFIDAHFMMIIAATDPARGQSLLQSMETYAVGGEGVEGHATNRFITAELGLPICRALLAYRGGDYATTIAELMPIRYQIHRIGGSHAQRDIFSQILVDALIRAGRLQEARALLAERVALRPNNCQSWKAYATTLAGLGEAAAAADASVRAEQLQAI